jgi:hypothetical protein
MARRGDRSAERVVVTCPCGKVFEVRRKRFEAGRGRRCSKACHNLYATRPSGLTYEKHKDNPTSFRPGEHRSPETEFKPGQRPWNDGVQIADPASWLRNSTQGYEVLHQKLCRKRGQAAQYRCNHADETCKGPMQWVNISHEYLGVGDFMPLCQSHHLRYDRAYAQIGAGLS